MHLGVGQWSECLKPTLCREVSWDQPNRKWCSPCMLQDLGRWFSHPNAKKRRWHLSHILNWTLEWFDIGWIWLNMFPAAGDIPTIPFFKAQYPIMFPFWWCEWQLAHIPSHWSIPWTRRNCFMIVANQLSAFGGENVGPSGPLRMVDV